MRVVEHLRPAIQVSIQHILRELERETHRVTIDVVADVVGRIDCTHRRALRVLLLPLLDVDHAATPVGFDNRRDERDDVLADVADVRPVVEAQREKGMAVGVGSPPVLYCPYGGRHAQHSPRVISNKGHGFLAMGPRPPLQVMSSPMLT